MISAQIEFLGGTGHVFGSCLFISYVPVKRLVTPMGRLMNSQKGLLGAKHRASLSGLLPGRKI